MLSFILFCFSLTELILAKFSRNPQLLLSLQNNEENCYLNLLACVRIIPSEGQGIEPFEVHATMNDKSISGIPEGKRSRFDWVELVDQKNKHAFNGLYSQIAALVEVKTPTFKEFFFIGDKFQYLFTYYIY